MNKQLTAAVWFVLAALNATAGTSDDLSKLSVDDLMNVEVTSVARHGEKLSDTAAAIFVITQDDIQRSGANTIAELLRMVPGLEVASVTGNVWAINARGFNNRGANQMLVMLDGRTLYSSVFSGVFWNIQDTMLEDIERIEVIRGPGGTLWGANAVNGVINIITKKAIVTHGTIASAGAGTIERAFGAVRYGGSIGDNFNYRVFAKDFDRSASTTATGAPIPDAWHGRHAGFRADWMATPRDNITFDGNTYNVAAQGITNFIASSDPSHGPWLADDARRGTNATMRWTETQSNRSETSLQLFYDYTDSDALPMPAETRTVDLDFQHNVNVSAGNKIVWGFGYRRVSDRTGRVDDMMILTPASTSRALLSTFVQDELKLSKSVKLTFGSKVQYDQVSQLQLQPSVRLLWRPDERSTAWGAITSAVRTPSRFELDSRSNLAAFPGPYDKTAFVVLEGNPNLRPERVLSYEAGYRRQPAPNTSFDVTLYYERLSNLVQGAAESPRLNSAGTLIMPIVYSNAIRAAGQGMELSSSWKASSRWDLRAGYALTRMRVSDPDKLDYAAELGSPPTQQFQLRSMLTLTSRLELDTTAYYVSRLSKQEVPAYTRLDVRLGWHVSPACELSIVGQNLLAPQHLEFNGVQQGTSTVPVKRSVYGKVTWRL